MRHAAARLALVRCLVKKRTLTMSSSATPDPERLLGLARAGNGPALGLLLDQYRNYLAMWARLQIGRRLQGKVDASDLVQETFLEAHRDFGQFRGSTEQELAAWLRRILAWNLANLVQRYCGAQRRDVRLERELAAEMDESSRVLELRSEEHTSELQSHLNLVCRLLLEKKKKRS